MTTTPSYPLLRVLALAVAGLLLAAAAAWAQPAASRRVALVIGNNHYPGAPLLNPVNDARAMAAALQASGFTVILRTDATQADTLAALREFGNRLKDAGAGAAGLFYFAGHGMQIKGRNFLVPVGANIEHEDEVAYQSVDAQAVLDKMESAGNGTNLVILDACRNNPFARAFRSGAQGLAAMEAPVGTLVAFATAPGAVASDGNAGSNGLYTTHLLNHIRQPGMKVEDVFKQVRAAVRRDSRGRQVPMEWSALEGDFYFTPARAELVLAPVPTLPQLQRDPQADIDDALWAAVKDSPISAEVFAYLNRFPSGRHAKAARERLLNLGAAPLAPAVAVAAPAAAAAITLPAPGSNSSGSVDLDRMLQEAEAAERERVAGIARAQRDIDEIVRWGEVGTDKRPENPKKNPFGFTEGDRWRWRVYDLAQRHYTGTDYLWRIDRVEADGALWVNDGIQRLDALGQPRGGNDEVSGEWIDWQPALPAAEWARRELAGERAVTTVVQRRDADGRITKASLGGRLKGPVADVAQTGISNLGARRVDAELRGPAVRSDGRQHVMRLEMSWWFVPGYGLPVLWDVRELHDERVVRHLRHELFAAEVLAGGIAPGR